MSTQETLDPLLVRIKRLRYQSWHRGCKETDVILGNYCDEHLKDATEEEIALMEDFLNEDDYDIWQWVAYDATPPDARYVRLIKKLQHFKPNS